MDFNIHSWLRVLALCAPMTVHATGFSLLEQTGSGIGYAYAGTAASADDASAMYFNPAALGLLSAPQIVVAAHSINLRAKFSDDGSTLPPAGLGLIPIGATHDDAGESSLVPNAYLAWPMNERLAFGFGVNVPFGLSTDYKDPWIGRFQGIRSELKTLNANPAVAWRLNERVSLGLGLNYQRADAKLSNAVLLGPATEGRAAIDADDNAFGWNAGVVFTLPTSTRIGLSYRSKLDFTLTGTTTVKTLGGVTITPVSGPTSVDVTFPDSAQVSFVQPVSSTVELRGDVNWVNWSKIQSLVPINPANGAPRDLLDFAFKNTVRVALGAGYKPNDRFTWRAGIAWDESPVRDAVRTVRLPDGDRKWLTIGAGWRAAEKVGVDFGYAHLFVADTAVAASHAQPAAPASFASLVRGNYENGVDIVSVQLSWTLR